MKKIGRAIVFLVYIDGVPNALDEEAKHLYCKGENPYRNECLMQPIDFSALKDPQKMRELSDQYGARLEREILNQPVSVEECLQAFRDLQVAPPTEIPALRQLGAPPAKRNVKVPRPVRRLEPI